ncbi:hypothetical protein Tco_0486386 [Tanacetum coccineum]
MIGQFLKEQAYIDLDSPINVMSKLNYRWIMSDGLKLRRKPSNPEKNCNIVGRVKGLRVFVRNFTYECDFVMLEDTTSVIDHYLGIMVLGKLFVEAFGLVYDKGEGTILKTDNIAPFIITDDDSDQEKIHYSNSLNLGFAYRRDENVTKAIQCLMKMKNRTNE